MVHMEHTLDQYIFIKWSHSDYSGEGWTSYIVGGIAKLGGLMKSWGVDTPLESMGSSKKICISVNKVRRGGR